VILKRGFLDRGTRTVLSLWVYRKKTKKKRKETLAGAGTQSGSQRKKEYPMGRCRVNEGDSLMPE